MRDHTKLRAFELADELALAVFRLTKTFPNAEQFGLTSQMRRGAVSVASNIVEGCARQGLPEYTDWRLKGVGWDWPRSGRVCVPTRSVGTRGGEEYQIYLAYRLGYLDSAFHQTLSAASDSPRN